MAKYKSILCPEKADHKYDKHLLFVGSEDLFVFCKDHFWIKISFKKGGKQINFENSAVTAQPMGENFHFDHEEMPILALGQFKLKSRTEEKRHVKYK